MKTTVGKLRNITTGILHTAIGDVYEFLEEYLDAKGIMTHQLPSACRALEPILKSKLPETWFVKEWVKAGLDVEAECPDLTEDEKKVFWESYEEHAGKLWDKIKDKTIIVQP
jgi:hypothetical protein